MGGGNTNNGCCGCVGGWVAGGWVGFVASGGGFFFWVANDV